MFSTRRCINEKEVSLDSQKTNCFLSDPWGMTSHSSAMSVLRREWLQQQGCLQDLLRHHGAAITATAAVPMPFSPAQPWLCVRHPQNPATSREERSAGLLWWFLQNKTRFSEKKRNSAALGSEHTSTIHKGNPLLFGELGAYSPDRQIPSLLQAFVFFSTLLLPCPSHTQKPCQVLHR